jgi:ATP-dependent Clp protease protease subunit
MTDTTDTPELARPDGSAFEQRLRGWMEASERAFSAAKADNDTIELSMMDIVGQDFWTGGGITSKAVQRELSANPNAKTIKILLNSPGGDAFEGLAIQSLLKRHGARVEVEIVGMAASAASIIAMAGDEISMHEGALMMIHEPWTFTVGNAAEMRTAADFLDKVNSSGLDVYTTRTGRDRDDVAEMLAAETWMTASEAVDAKFATAVIKQPKASEKTTKARSAAQAFMSARKPTARSSAQSVSDYTVNINVVATADGKSDMASALADAINAAINPSITPAPEGSAVQQTPDLGEDQYNMTAPSNSFPATVALALGLPVGSSETDILACITRHRDTEKEVLAISGQSMVSEGIGALRGFKSKAEQADKLSAELSTVKGERDKQNFETLIVKGKSEGQLVPATVKLYEERFNAASGEGRGESVVNDLRGFLAVQPRVIPSQAIQASVSTPSAPLVWQGKQYSELTYSQRANLAKQDPALFAEMKRDFDASKAA